MAYVPPHKRQSTEAKGRTLTPELLAIKFKKKLNVRPFRNSDNTDKFTYANNAIHRWIPIGLGEDEQIPPSIQLQPIPMEAIEQRMGLETLKLVNSAQDSEPSRVHAEHWRSIAENVLQDLLASFQAVRNEMNDHASEEVKPSLVVRLGKILFRSSCKNPSNMTKEAGYSPTEASLRSMRRIFYTNVPTSYRDYIKSEVIPQIGVKFQKKKDIYHIKLSDTSRPGTTISCKCRVLHGASRLELYKVELNHLRHMIVDISCLDKNLDLRLMLCSKRIITTLTKEEWKSITNLVRSAVPDGNVKGGLLWPSGKAFYGNRFRVVGVWHTICETYESSAIRLKLRHADRFDFGTSTGEVTREVVVKLKRVASALLGQKLEIDSISNMLKGELKLMWEHFLPNRQVLM